MAHLSPAQVWGRPGFRVRRQLAPRLLVPAARLWPARTPVNAWDSRCDVSPAVLDTGSLQKLLEENVLALAGHEAPLPDAPPFEPSCRDPLYLYSFHELGWLRAAFASGGMRAAQRARLARWLQRYLAHTPPWRSVYWDPYPIAGRILSLDAMARRGDVSAETARARIVEGTVALAGLSETHLQGNHLLRNKAAFLAGSSWLGGSGRLLRRGALSRLTSECMAQFLDDGCHEERTPGYHMHCLLDVLHALGSMDAPDTASAGELREIAAQATSALETMEHPDGLLAAFGDTAPASCPRPGAIRAWARGLGVRVPSASRSTRGQWSLQRLPIGGFASLRGPGLDIYVKDGPFGARHQPGHAHCDLFGMEVDVNGVRAIVDPGVHAYHDPEWRHRTRASASHCTPTLPDREQAEIWSRFRCGWRPRLRAVSWRGVESGFELRGEAEAFGPKHPRRIRRWLRTENGSIRIEDRILDATTVQVAIPLAPDIHVNVEGMRAQLMHAGQLLAILHVERGRISRSAGHVSHRFGERASTVTLRLVGDAAGIAWRIEAAS